MKRQLPPLNSLRAFEAAARFQSFTKAADELFVTAGAISRQVQVLEDHLGKALFTRKNRELILTLEGEQYRDSLTKAFDQINTSTQHFKQERRLSIGSHMTFGMQWLVPRLGAFMDAHPNMPLSISTSHPVLDDVASGTLHLAIMGGTEESHWPGVITHKLFRFSLTPVASPELVERISLKSPKDLSKTTLLHSAIRPDDWNFWLDKVGISPTTNDSGTTFESSCIAYKAAARGLGVAMGQRHMLTEEFENKSLICPFDQSFTDGTWFYLAYSNKFADHRPIIRFKEWILEEVEQFNNQLQN